MNEFKKNANVTEVRARIAMGNLKEMSSIYVYFIVVEGQESGQILLFSLHCPFFSFWSIFRTLE